MAAVHPGRLCRGAPSGADTACKAGAARALAPVPLTSAVRSNTPMFEHAKALLEDRTRSVTLIGLSLGFNETSSFTTILVDRAATTEAPDEIRKALSMDQFNSTECTCVGRRDQRQKSRVLQTEESDQTKGAIQTNPQLRRGPRQHIPGFMLIAILSETKRGCLRDRAYQRGSNGLSAPPGSKWSWASNWEMGAMSCLRELHFSLCDARNTANCSRGEN